MVQRGTRRTQGYGRANRRAFGCAGAAGPEGIRVATSYPRAEDEFFVVLSGEVRVQHGEAVIEAVAGSIVYGPRDVPHAFHVDSAEARILLFFGPAGVEGFFRDGGKPARSDGLPPADEQFLDKQKLQEIAAGYKQEFVGPPLPPKD